MLQKRLHDAYAASAPDEALARDFSPFAQLAIILGMSGALWGVLAWVVSRLV